MSSEEEKNIDSISAGSSAAAAAMTSTEKATTPLRICCYGSSSSRTPSKYTDAAYNLGYYVAQRAHTCVNAAGNAGENITYVLLCSILLCKYVLNLLSQTIQDAWQQ